MNGGPVVARLSPERKERFEERAAIREFDGGFSREEAERLAMEDCGFVRKADAP